MRDIESREREGYLISLSVKTYLVISRSSATIWSTSCVGGQSQMIRGVDTNRIVWFLHWAESLKHLEDSKYSTVCSAYRTQCVNTRLSLLYF